MSYLCEKRIPVHGHTLIFSYNPTVNLFIHTLNLYRLLGHHGEDYALLQCEKVKSVIDGALAERVMDGDWYFSYGRHGIYCPGMETIMTKKLYDAYPDAENMRFGVGDAYFERAFRETWTGFYREYWDENIEKKRGIFDAVVGAYAWEKLFSLMQSAAQRPLDRDIYVFPADALGSSGITFSDNVTLGSLERGDDMAVVHEGLHLLLGEKWGDAPEIKAYFETHPFGDGFYKNYRQKYEQIFVLITEHILLGKEDMLGKACKNCHVSELLPAAYPIVRMYFDSGFSEPLWAVMLAVIREARK